MRDLAPDITRQRLLIEGLFGRDIGRDDVARYLVDLAAHLSLRTYGDPIVHAPGSAGSEDNQGFDGFIPLIDSGISLYVWSKRRFFAVVLFTCKTFDDNAALDFTQKFFESTELEHREF
jgi:S-adenosylmethionine decarboxylase